MPVNKEELDRHIADYAEVTGQNIGKFVCPITERICEESELINGHILNEALVDASNLTVIQYGDVDNYFGRTVEPDFVRFANIRTKSPHDLIAETRRAIVIFKDGSNAEGFFADALAAAAYPKLQISVNGVPVENFYVRLAKDDPRLMGTSAQVEWGAKFSNAAWTATLIKSAYLALFSQLGYSFCKNDASGEYIRQTLHGFYRDKATKADAPRYFYPFRNAVKIALRADGVVDTDKDVPDTLTADTYLVHFRSRDDVPFAVTLRFRINDLITTVTLPATIGDNTESIRTYNHLMEDESSVAQYIRWTVLKDGKWNMNASKHQIRYKS